MITAAAAGWRGVGNVYIIPELGIYTRTWGLRVYVGYFPPFRRPYGYGVTSRAADNSRRLYGYQQAGTISRNRVITTRGLLHA